MNRLLNFLFNIFSPKSKYITSVVVHEDIITPEGEVLIKEEEEIDMSVLRIIRYMQNDKGTLGDIIFPCGTVLKSLELPWRNNQDMVSCIPVGVYDVNFRVSPVVNRTSKGKYPSGYEVANVPDREFIMFHIGNYIRNTHGCILVGMSAGIFLHSEPAVWSSAKAFDIFMRLMKSHNITTVSIEIGTEKE